MKSNSFTPLIWYSSKNAIRLPPLLRREGRRIIIFKISERGDLQFELLLKYQYNKYTYYPLNSRIELIL